MARKSGLLMALALLVLTPAVVSSLGLGDIRLNSYLNEPLDAEVTIAVSSPEELETLEVAVASDEAFDRFGLDRPRFLSDLVFTVEPGPGADATLRIRSPEPVVEPFLTFLVEANWAGGRLLREYTVLLDPPLFLPEPAQAPQPQAPVADTPGTGVITAPTAQPAPAPRATVAPPAVAPPAVASPAVAAPASYGPVRRNDTLWRIASEVRPDRSVSVNQTMLALFEANPDAFEGNINVLRAGSTLRVPSRDEIARIGQARATAEVRRQHSEWSPGTAAGAPVPAPTVGPAARPAVVEVPAEERLELVVPGQTDKAGGPAASEAPEAGQASQEYVAEQEALNREMLSALQSLRDELEETRQLIELKDAEIASLQNRLGEIENAAVPVDVPIEVPVESPPATIGGAEEAAGEPATADTAATAAPATEAEPAPTTAAPAPVTRPAEAQGLLSSRWLWLAVALAVLLALALVWKRRQRLAEEEDSYGTFEPAPRRPVEPVAVATGAAATAGFLVEEQPAPSRARPAPVPAPDAVEEEIGRIGSGERFDEPDLNLDDDRPGEAPEAPRRATAAAEYQYPFEDTIAGATGIDLDQSDPLAEADFHMAYGLYDQAADLVGKAVEREPDRVDLRMKLLDILFVWGKEGRFLTEAKALRKLVDEDGAEWGRVSIMGRQICPDETLFAGQGGAGIDVAVDATEAGETTAAASDSLDFDIGADETAVADDDLIDFDLGVTGERPAVRQEGVSPDQTAELEIEDLGLDLDLGDATGEVLAGLAAAAGETGVDIDLEGLGADGESPRRDVGDTAEVLGLQSADAGDTAELTTLGETMAREAIDEEDQTEVYGGMDEPTELAPMPDSDDRTARLERADVTEASHAADDEEASLSLDVGLTGLTEILEATTKIGDEGATVVAQTVEMPSSKSTDDDLEDYSSQVEQPDFSTRRLEAVVDESDLDDDDTAEVEAIEEADPRLDLDDLTAALSADLERSEGSDEAGDLRDGDDLIGEIFGGQEETTRIAPGFEVLTARDAPAQKEDKLEAAPPDVTLDEVGTKLDLARAYIDMGDPDGARSILEEVLSEGNDRQRDEAQQLMDGVT